MTSTPKLPEPKTFIPLFDKDHWAHLGLGDLVPVLDAFRELQTAYVEAWFKLHPSKSLAPRGTLDDFVDFVEKR